MQPQNNTKKYCNYLVKLNGGFSAIKNKDVMDGVCYIYRH